jgi:hypothetical protein
MSRSDLGDGTVIRRRVVYKAQRLFADFIGRLK